MTTPAPTLSIVVPVYNEAGNVAPLAEEISRAASATGHPYEILFVNDGSRDATLARLSALAALGPGVDVASGRRQRREEPFFSRVLPSRVANGMIVALTGVPAHDCGCGLKAYRRRVLEGIQLPRGMNRFLPAILGVDGRRVVEVSTKDRPRGSGTSHYGLARVFVVLRDLLALPLLSHRPLPGPARQVGLERAARALCGAAGLTVIGAVTLPALRPVLLGAATGLGAGAAVARAVAFNVTRFMRAQEDRVFRVREVLDHANLSAPDRDRGRGVLGQELVSDLRQAANRPYQPPLRP